MRKSKRGNVARRIWRSESRVSSAVSLSFYIFHVQILPNCTYLLERKGALDNAQEDGEGFDVAVEDAISERPSKRGRSDGPGGKRGLPRQARDKKFGYGGPGRRAKQNTKESTDSFVGRGSGGGRGGKKGGAPKSKRPGKSKRMNARSRP